MLVSVAHPEMTGATPTGPDDGAARDMMDRDTRAALHHNAILTAYCVTTDVAPVRFGAAVSGRAAAVDLLTRDAARYRSVLDRIAGCVEYALRVTDMQADALPVPPPPSDTGRGYLARARSRRDLRALRDDAQQAALQHLTGTLRTLTCEVAALSGGQVQRRLDLALLVPRGDEDALVAACAIAHDQLAGLRLALSLGGPWPPYSFAAGPDSSADERVQDG